VKISVSFPSEVVVYLDGYAERHGHESRSAVVQEAIRLLQAAELGNDYLEAWQEWDSEGDAELWAITADDGDSPDSLVGMDAPAEAQPIPSAVPSAGASAGASAVAGAVGRS
jgi:Arc/MetJ-type ribon-helix-helix transcriptional regulator